MLGSLVASYGDSYPILYAFIQENLLRIPEKHASWSHEMKVSNREFEKVFVQVVADGMRDGTVRDVGSPRLVAYGLLGMAGWTYRWFDPHTSEESSEQIAQTFADTLLFGLQTGRRPAAGKTANAGAWARKPGPATRMTPAV